VSPLQIPPSIMETSLGSAASLARSAKAPQAREAGSHPAVSNPAFDELLRKAQAGDHQAFAALVSEARPRALAVALKVLRNPDDAQDARQEDFLDGWRFPGRSERRRGRTPGGLPQGVALPGALRGARLLLALDPPHRDERQPRSGAPAELP